MSQMILAQERTQRPSKVAPQIEVYRDAVDDLYDPAVSARWLQIYGRSKTGLIYNFALLVHAYRTKCAERTADADIAFATSLRDFFDYIATFNGTFRARALESGGMFVWEAWRRLKIGAAPSFKASSETQFRLEVRQLRAMMRSRWGHGEEERESPEQRHMQIVTALEQSKVASLSREQQEALKTNVLAGKAPRDVALILQKVENAKLFGVTGRRTKLMLRNIGMLDRIRDALEKQQTEYSQAKAALRRAKRESVLQNQQSALNIWTKQRAARQAYSRLCSLKAEERALKAIIQNAEQRIKKSAEFEEIGQIPGILLQELLAGVPTPRQAQEQGDMQNNAELLAQALGFPMTSYAAAKARIQGAPPFVDVPLMYKLVRVFTTSALQREKEISLLLIGVAFGFTKYTAAQEMEMLSVASSLSGAVRLSADNGEISDVSAADYFAVERRLVKRAEKHTSL